MRTRSKRSESAENHLGPPFSPLVGREGVMAADALTITLDADLSIQLLGEAAKEIERLTMELEFQTKRADKAEEKTSDLEDVVEKLGEEVDGYQGWEARHEELEEYVDGAADRVIQIIRDSQLREAWDKLEWFAQKMLEDNIAAETGPL